MEKREGEDGRQGEREDGHPLFLRRGCAPGVYLSTSFGFLSFFFLVVVVVVVLYSTNTNRYITDTYKTK